MDNVHNDDRLCYSCNFTFRFVSAFRCFMKTVTGLDILKRNHVDRNLIININIILTDTKFFIIY